MSVAGQNATEQFWQFHNKTVLNKYKRLKIGTIGEPKQEIKSSSSDNKKGGLSDRVFGDLVPYGDPSWYQGWHSPYYNDSHKRWRAYCRQYVQEHLIDNAHQWDEAKAVPRTEHKRMGDAGMLTITYTTA